MPQRYAISFMPRPMGSMSRLPMPMRRPMLTAPGRRAATPIDPRCRRVGDRIICDLVIGNPAQPAIR